MGERGPFARRVRRWAPMAPIAAAAALAVWVTISQVFPDGSLNLDEVAYDAQAHALAEGQLTLPGETHLPHFRPYLSGIVDDEVVFKYQPLWPASIAASRTIGLGDVTLRALMGAAGAIGVGWFAYELTRRRRVALISAAIVAGTPFLWLQAATLLAYHPSLVHLSFAGALLLRSAHHRASVLAITGGAMATAGLLLRPFDALLCLSAVGVYALLRADHARGPIVARWGAGAVPVAALVLLYNQRVTGSPFHTAFNTAGGADRFGFGPRASFIADPDNPGMPQVFSAADAVGATGESLATLLPFLVAGPVLVVLAVRTIVVRRRDAETRLLVGMGVLVVVGYGFWWGIANLIDFGLHRSHGPAYHYALLLAIVPLAAVAADRTDRGGLRFGAPMLAIGGLLWLPANLGVLTEAQEAGEERSNRVAAEQAASRPTEGSAPTLVLRQPEFPGDPYVRVANPPDLGGPVVVGIDTGDDRLPVVDRYPTYDINVILEEHPLGDAFGPTVARLESVSLLEAAESIVWKVAGQTPGEGVPDIYVLSAAGLRWHDGPMAEVTITAADTAAPEGDIYIGLAHRQDDGTVVARYGCRFDADLRDDGFRMLTLCNGFQNYRFINSDEVLAREDIRSVLLVTPMSVDDQPLS